MNRQRFLMLTSGLAIGLAMASVAAAQDCPGLTSDIDPDNFVPQVTNKYFPLTPGTTFFYEGEKDGVPTSDVVHVTHDTKTILGVKCIVVHHQSYEGEGKDRVLVEVTDDYYAQDKVGNVWYFGEDTRALDPATGKLSDTEGTWRAGRKVPTGEVALPGIIMEARPRVGHVCPQERAPGVAEDMAQVLSLDESIRVLGRDFDNVLQIEETTPLEPDVAEQKYYVKGIGFVRGVMVKGGEEHTELVRVDHDD